MTNIAKGLSLSTFGSDTCSKIKSNNGCKFSLGSSNSFAHHPALPDAYKIGKSNCSSVASRETNKSKTSSITSLGLPSGLSILLITTMGLRPCFNAFPKTNFVCGIGPSAASTKRITPSVIPRTRSTSPPKSA